MKVFELAKELDVRALDLITKIKPLEVNIKNHMSELNEEEVQKIRDFLSSSSDKKAAPKKKTTVRKKKSVIKRRSTVIRRKTSEEEVKEEAELTKEAAESVNPENSVESSDASAVPSVEVSQSNEVESEADVAAKTSEEEAVDSVKLPKPLKLDKEKKKERAAENTAPEKKSEELEASKKSEKEEEASQEKEIQKEEKKSLFSFLKLAKKEEPTERKPLIVEESVDPNFAAEAEELRKEMEDDSPMRRFENDDDAQAQRSAADIIREMERAEASQKKRGSGFGGSNAIPGGKQFHSTDYLRRERVYQNRKKRPGMTRFSASKPSGGVSTVEAKNKSFEFDTRISVEDLAHAMSQKVRKIAYTLDSLGVEKPAEIRGFSQWYLDLDTVQLIAQEFGYAVKDRTFYEEDVLNQARGEEFPLLPRAPVVTIMGHVDHGKTSLLDLIRRARVADKEAGGITQHIAAYTVKVSEAVLNLATEEERKALKKEKKKNKGKKKKESQDDSCLTFLDTPGHAAFSSMRSRGAQCTDIVVLVVAATEGVMPQTKEAVDHAKAAGVPIIVALNKMDLPEANPDKIVQQLSEIGVISEEWGGDTLFTKVSAKTGEGVGNLLEQIKLQAELLELTAPVEGPGAAIVVEARLDKGRGPLVTALMSEGTLKIGDSIVCGVETGKVRALIDDKGKNVKEAGPSIPVVVLGLSGVPEAGDSLNVVDSEKDARDLSEKRKIEKEEIQKNSSKMTLEDLYSKMNEGSVQELPVVLKADVRGSAEAIKGSLDKLPQSKVKVNVISTAVGGISESDVLLASASQAIILGFNVRPDAKSMGMAESRGVQIKTYEVIYNLIDDVRNAMEGLLAPTIREEVLGQAEVRDVFNLSKGGVIAGCHVSTGKMQRGSFVRLLREGVVIFSGEMAGLRRFKDDVKEVQSGYECGVSIVNYADIKKGDVIESYLKIETATKLEDAGGVSSEQASENANA